VYREHTLNTAWVRLNKMPANQKRLEIFWTLWDVSGLKLINLIAFAWEEQICHSRSCVGNLCTYPYDSIVS
jgi:hypothetical protein